ncbi:hypothetical protein [Paenibacillus sp. LHD-38]|uniref:hypothetical protein n=1 Tax=Paenibacillus sp. LHD-38 TaxID=3072143 RepID=UPI0028106672|nr:hypothetical protein [Paenibacillus sp. LHD-38]MDQ8736657.1 hypothetical protein [Paenibacillus sp. LHD-38]
MEIDMLNIAQSQSFTPIQLSPTAPIGSCSVVAAVDQNKIIDQGSYSFEKQAFWEHVYVYQSLFQALFQADLEIILSTRSGYKDTDGLLKRVIQYGQDQSIKIKLSVIEDNEENQYYKGLQFTIRTVINGTIINIGDGGFVDWPAQLLGNKKERMLISAIGLDRLLPIG